VDTVIIFVIVFYEALAAAWTASSVPGSPPLITDVVMAGGRLARWAFVIGLIAVMVDHLSLVNVPLL